MRGPKPPTIHLSDLEREQLDALTRRHSTPSNSRSARASSWQQPPVPIMAKLLANWSLVSTWSDAGVSAGYSAKPPPCKTCRSLTASLTPRVQANPCALPLSRSPKSSPSLASHPQTLTGPSATGPAVNSLTRSNSAASLTRSQRAMRHACSKGGS